MKKLVTLGLSMTLAATSHASTMYVLASDTSLSGISSWASFDAAYADYIFTPASAVDLKTISVLSPSGKKLALQNGSEGELRSTFDVELTEKGTYAVESVRAFYYAKYKKKDEQKLHKWKGSAAEFAEKIKDKAFAAQVQEVRDYTMRADTFVSLGEPSDNGLKASSAGYDLDFLTHPNDNIVGETAEFVLKKDGKPVSGAIMKLERSGARLAANRDVSKLTTDAKGHFSVTWKKPGRYALSIRFKGEKPKDKLTPQKRVRYYATLDVAAD